MSLEAAIGRIDQILQLQQQISQTAGGSSAAAATGGVAPGASAGSTAATGTTAGDATQSSSTNDQAAFAAALADAQAASASADAASPTATADATSDATSSLTDPLSSGLLDSLSPAALSSTSALSSAAAPLASDDIASAGSSSAPASVQAMVAEANSLVGKPYVWGGGHSGWGQQAGYDCSGFVSAVLHAGGYLSSPQDTQTLPSAAGIESGPGQYVTIYDRTDAGSGDDHVIIDLGGQFYESGGESGAWGGGGGVEKIATPSASYLASFNQVLHPSGL